METNPVKAIAIIPARLASTRLPRKVLCEIAGRPMLAYVYDAARACPGFEDVIVATDSDEIAAVCSQNGWPCRMTSPEHRSGTDRVHEVAQTVAADVYVNIQGDEPLARREHLDVLLELMQRDGVEVGTLKTICDTEDVNNPNAVKVVDLFGRSRSLLLSRDDSLRPRQHWNGALLQALGLLRLSQVGARSLSRLAGISAGAHGAIGAVALPGERRRHPRRRNPL